ncbi:MULTISPECIES: ribonuclease E/G [unclassified Minwuia]|jgi:ribonuclease E|uniref:Rne/Rng family ribonuclease n=1 Tax=unclassified Minwuia TaxID=2618799 RepID=UPI00247B1A3E|nr:MULTISPECIES: ribonuclease E/G [unclassified Minwuia]
MATRMLVDAAHPEETRVVIVKGNRLDEFDFEVDSRKPLKGNIYLAKVTRVEPSLQAAFVEFGGNRHGFLAFNEIHPDYYQIPVADREALIAEQQREVARVAEAEEAEIEEEGEGEDDQSSEDGDDESRSSGNGRNRRGRGRGRNRRRGSGPTSDEDSDLGVEDVGGDELEEDIAPRRPSQHSRPYKIQEVIKRRQILLVQAVKEERGNKGAALTTYLSLAGRYCVLMPNTARGGGISRKIANVADRKKLKSAVKELDVPEGTGVIVRTAGAKRTKSEIKRDFEFLLRLWDDIRDLTLRSTAPTLVYEEASLITRAIRDFYSKDIDEVLVEGEDGYRVAKDFMKRIMPSHAKKVQPYRDRIPLFHRYQVEQQLDSMYGNEVTLPSGGYIVINSTEALVAIDVNSGKSTKGRSIEETATKTNLEAAEEVARQLRLRDLAGLVVIDFIDMDESRNNRAVERKLKDCLRVDRARIQIGRISHFGLLEMSRQRLRPGVQDVNMMPCSHCHGLGVVRSIDSTALHLLRSIEEEGIRERSAGIRIHMPAEVAIYIVNHKRRALAEIEERYGFAVEIAADMELVSPDHRIERIAASEISEEIERPQRETTAPAIEHEDDEDAADQTNAHSDDDEDEAEQRGSDDDGGRPRSRRRRRRRGGASSDQDSNGDSSGQEASQGDDADGGKSEEAASGGDDDDDGEGKNRRRRGRRGGRRRRGRKDDDQSSNQQNGSSDVAPLGDGEVNEEGIQSPFLMAAAVPPSQVQAEIVAEQSSPDDEPADGTTPDQASPDHASDETGNGEAEAEAGSDDTVEPSGSGDVADASNDDAPEASAEQAEEEGQPADDDAVPERAPEAEAEAGTETETEVEAPAAAEAEAEVEVAVETEVTSDAEPEPVAASAEEPETTSAAEPAPELEPVADAAPKAPAKRGWWSRKRRDD